jgi:hypothetical protein
MQLPPPYLPVQRHVNGARNFASSDIRLNQKSFRACYVLADSRTNRIAIAVCPSNALGSVQCPRAAGLARGEDLLGCLKQFSTLSWLYVDLQCQNPR